MVSVPNLESRLAFDVAFRNLSIAFERAAQTCPGACCTSFHVFAGRVARVRVVGRRLAARIRRPFAHVRLRAAPTEPADLTVDLWDEAETGVQSGVAFSQTGKSTPDGRFVAHTEDQITTVLDRGQRRLVGRVLDSERLGLLELGRPLFAPLMLWHQDRNAPPVHTGLVAWKGEGVLLGGPGGSGKSTVALRCLEAGFDFVSDDYVSLENANGAFTGHGVFCSAHLADDDLEGFPDLAPVARPRTRPDEAKPLVLLSEVFDRRLARSATIRAVALPHVTGASSPSVRRVSKIETLLRIAPTSVLLLPYARQGLDMLARLVETVPTYRLELGANQAAIPDRVRGILADAKL